MGHETQHSRFKAHRLTGNRDVGDKAARLNWDWAGYVSRMHPDRTDHQHTMDS